MTYYDRNVAGLDPRRGGSRFDADDVRGVAIHWNGPPVGAGAARGEHAGVRSYLRGIQRFHQVTRGWSDVAYNLAVDNAGNIWELRGLDYRSAANGDATTNARYVAILAVLGEGQRPTDAMYAGLRTAISRARGRYPGADTINTHNDVRPEPTACPGPDLTRAIKRGELEPGAAPKPAPTPKPPEEDIMASKAELRDVVRQEVRAAVNDITRAVEVATEVNGFRYPQVNLGTKDEPDHIWGSTALQRTLNGVNALRAAQLDPQELGAAIAAAMPPDARDVATVEAAVRNVLGSLDDPDDAPVEQGVQQ